MELLIVARTLFYFVVSTAIIVLGILGAVMTYHLIHITRHLRNISGDLEDTSEEMKERLENVIKALASLPILGYFLRGGSERTVRHARRIK